MQATSPLSPFFAIDVPVRQVDRSKSRIAAAAAAPLSHPAAHSYTHVRMYRVAGADVVWNKGLDYKDLHLLKVDRVQQTLTSQTT